MPIHVDAASGGFVAPFFDEDLEWDFRVPRVQSINASGHKYGLVYPGVGWIIWRDSEALPQDLVFDVEYLGGHMPTFALNFSRPGAQVVAQYFMFLRLGREGYRRIQEACCETANWIADQVDSMEQFALVSREPGIPVVAFKMVGERGYTVYDVSETTAGQGLARPRLPDAARHAGHVRPAGSRQKRVESRHGGDPRRRSEVGRGTARAQRWLAVRARRLTKGISPLDLSALTRSSSKVQVVARWSPISQPSTRSWRGSSPASASERTSTALRCSEVSTPTGAISTC